MKRTELKRHQPLKPRSAPLARGAGPQRQAPMKRSGPIAYKQLRRELMDPAIRTAVLVRDLGRCVICGGRVDPDWWECHHRKLRSQGGTDDMSNLLTLHPSCHERAHGNRSWSRAHGFIVHRPDDPAEVRVLWHGQMWVLPSEGEWVASG